MAIPTATTDISFGQSPTDPPQNVNAIVATYSSKPNLSEKKFESSLPNLSSATSTEEKTQYLAALHSSTIQLQKKINGFLTEKMEIDKANLGSQGTQSRDEKEEENYGEEADDD